MDNEVKKVPFFVRVKGGREYPNLLSKGGIYKVVVIVEKGYDYHGAIRNTGYIVMPESPDAIDPRCPYVWDTDRFEHVERREVTKVDWVPV